MSSDEPLRSFAGLLRRARAAAGLTQEALADRAGVSWRAISDLERGVKRPRRDTLELLADALVLPAEERAIFSTAARQPILRVAGPQAADNKPSHGSSPWIYVA
ncbi:MAG: helix-turn-helix domain-containing protein, partial [Chloroflexota bacterium]